MTAKGKRRRLYAQFKKIRNINLSWNYRTSHFWTSVDFHRRTGERFNNFTPGLNDSKRIDYLLRHLYVAKSERYVLILNQFFKETKLFCVEDERLCPKRLYGTAESTSQLFQYVLRLLRLIFSTLNLDTFDTLLGLTLYT